MFYNFWWKSCVSFVKLIARKSFMLYDALVTGIVNFIF